MQHLTLLLLTANRKAMSSSVALLFFTLLATLSLLPPCHARSLTTVHAQELNNWHRNPVVMAKAGRTQVEVADEKAGNASRSTAKGSRSKFRAAEPHVTWFPRLPNCPDDEKRNDMQFEIASRICTRNDVASCGKKGDDGKQKYFCFGCAKSGKTVSQAKNALYSRPSIKTNCKAKINVVIRNDDNFVINSFDNALKKKIEKEKNLDFGSFNSMIPVISGYPIERQFQSFYTNNLFKLFQDEIRRLMFCNTSLVRQEGVAFIFEVVETLLGKNGDPIRDASFRACDLCVDTNEGSHSTGCLEKEVFIKRIYMEDFCAYKSFMFCSFLRPQFRQNLCKLTMINETPIQSSTGKSRRVQNNSASNTATGQLTNTNNELEKAKRNLKKANSSPVRNKTKDDINVKY
ncbi:hypothetical protein ZIOFF_032741 [Zingiber officinale]|uniref:Protein FAR1-RELATED SEQUENCE n=1 Tax=Zingiber officinale TaxID=94328 RepID=A0A8J5L5W3_ZINOF|nr:hypothetical protein ZIOFF_032741 [Zingiber officinale]